MNNSVCSKKSSGCSNGVSPVLFNFTMMSVAKKSYYLIGTLSKGKVKVDVYELVGYSAFRVERIEGCTFDSFISLVSRLQSGRANCSHASLVVGGGLLLRVFACNM